MLNKKNNGGSVLVIGLNSVWQNNLYFESLVTGQVNRVATKESFASGKGMNFLRAFQLLNGEACLMAVLGGATGHLFETFCANHQVLISQFTIEAPTRVCHTLMDSETATEIIEPSPSLSTPENQRFGPFFEASLKSHTWAAICGSFPDNLPVASMIESLKRNHIKVMLDHVPHALNFLEAGVVELVKINAQELFELTGVDDIKAAGLRFLDKFPSVKALGVTNAEQPAFLFTNDRVASFVLNDTEPVLNPIGAGDAVSACWLQGCLSGLTYKQAFVRALAVGKASCAESFPSFFRKALAESIESLISVAEVKM